MQVYIQAKLTCPYIEIVVIDPLVHKTFGDFNVIHTQSPVKVQLKMTRGSDSLS